MKTSFLLTICFLLISRISFAQDDAHHKFHPHHTLGIVLSHTQISQGIQANGNKKWLALPSWGINYNYKCSPKWAFGLHNDIILEDFQVEEHLKSGSGVILKRSYPIASALVASFKPGKHFSYMLGSGAEFAHSGNYFLIRAGVEYGYHINKHWELNANLLNDFKLNAYNSFSIGFGVTTIF